MRKLKKMAADRIRQVLTVRERYGPNHYETIGAMSATFNDRRIAKKAILKRWHPDWFDESGEMLPQYEKELDRANKRTKQ
jgi:hypothetical protein